MRIRCRLQASNIRSRSFVGNIRFFMLILSTGSNVGQTRERILRDQYQREIEQQSKLLFSE